MMLVKWKGSDSASGLSQLWVNGDLQHPDVHPEPRGQPTKPAWSVLTPLLSLWFKKKIRSETVLEEDAIKNNTSQTCFLYLLLRILPVQEHAQKYYCLWMHHTRIFTKQIDYRTMTQQCPTHTHTHTHSMTLTCILLMCRMKKWHLTNSFVDKGIRELPCSSW